MTTFTFPRYMGTTTGDVARFLNNYALQLPQFATALNLSAAQVAYIKDGAAIYNWLELVYLPQLRAAAKAGTDARDEFGGDKDPTPFTPSVVKFTAPPITTTPINDGFVGFVDNQVKQIRLSAAYKSNSQIGTQLGIAGTTPPVVTPQQGSLAGLTGLAGFKMEVRANRYGAKTVLFYDMADATSPKLLAALASATFEDERPPTVPGQSEMRSYAVRYGDTQGRPLPNSRLSDVASLPTHP